MDDIRLKRLEYLEEIIKDLGLTNPEIIKMLREKFYEKEFKNKIINLEESEKENNL